MSLYQFFASDKFMPEFDNMHVIPFFDESGLSGIKIKPGFSEETAIRIIIEDDFTYSSMFTKLKYINYIEWCYSDDRACVIIEYIKNLLKNRKSVSMFNTWLDDKSELIIKKISINNLSIDTIKNLWGKDHFEQNECYIVYK